jgi:hypothetical protein
VAAHQARGTPARLRVAAEGGMVGAVDPKQRALSARQAVIDAGAVGAGPGAAQRIACRDAGAAT